MLNIKCPQCGKSTSWTNNLFRPFCCERCQLIDLGDWLTEQNAIPDISELSDAENQNSEIYQ